MRLGSGGGRLVGETHMVSPTEGGSPTSIAESILAKLSGVTGFQEVCLVFKNPGTLDGQTQFIVTEPGFQKSNSIDGEPSPAVSKGRN